MLFYLGFKILKALLTQLKHQQYFQIQALDRLSFTAAAIKHTYIWLS